MKFLNTQIQITHSPKNIIPYNDTCDQDASTHIIPWIKIDGIWRPLYSDLDVFLTRCSEFTDNNELKEFIIKSTNDFELDYQYMIINEREALIETNQEITFDGIKYNIDIESYNTLLGNEIPFAFRYLLLNTECSRIKSTTVTFKVHYDKHISTI